MMPRTLVAPGGRPWVVNTTTTVKLAERMLAAASAVSAGLPSGFYPPSPMNILLEMYLSLEGCASSAARDAGVRDGMHPRVAERWIRALMQEGLVESVGDKTSLTARGNDAVMEILEAVFHGQRQLD